MRACFVFTLPLAPATRIDVPRCSSSLTPRHNPGSVDCCLPQRLAVAGAQPKHRRQALPPASRRPHLQQACASLSLTHTSAMPFASYACHARLHASMFLPPLPTPLRDCPLYKRAIDSPCTAFLPCPIPSLVVCPPQVLLCILCSLLHPAPPVAPCDWPFPAQRCTACPVLPLPSACPLETNQVSRVPLPLPCLPLPSSLASHISFTPNLGAG